MKVQTKKDVQTPKSDLSQFTKQQLSDDELKSVNGGTGTIIIADDILLV